MEEEIIPSKEPLVRVEVDTNSYYEWPSKPMIRASVVEELQLETGQWVMAYMPPDPEDEWLAVVGFDASLPIKWQWWVEILG